MAEIEWRHIDDAFISRMDELDSHELVKRLWDGDGDAWRYIHARAVLPMLKRASLGRMAYDRSRSDMDICAAVFDYLIAQKKLELYKHSCPLVYWIRFWVMKDILRYCKKNDNPVSEEGLESVLTSDETPFDSLAFNDELNWCYMRLWKENRAEAKVLYLRAVENRSSLEVMRILKISSEDNVNQKFSRARKKMRRYIEESRKVNVDAVTHVDPEVMEVLV